MELFTLYYGRKKAKMRPIMTDSFKKCDNYMKARQNNVVGFHEILPAKKGESAWKQKSTTVGGNKCEIPIIRRGKTRINGWISKDGFNPHT